MIIQLNTDKNISGNERLESYLNTVITEELNRFSDDITRVEVHLSDENGAKGGANDKRCLLEARMSNQKPVAATAYGSTIEKAVSESLVKLKAILGKK